MRLSMATVLNDAVKLRSLRLQWTTSASDSVELSHFLSVIRFIFRAPYHFNQISQTLLLA